MGTYTLKCCLLKQLNSNRKTISGILYSFSDDFTEHILAVDESNKILDIYGEIANNCEHVSSWYNLLADEHDPMYIKVKVDISKVSNNEELFLTVASATKVSQVLIADNHQGWENYSYCNGSIIEFDKKKVRILDKNEAITELKSTKPEITFIDKSKTINDMSKKKKEIKAIAKKGGIASIGKGNVNANTGDSEANFTFNRKSFGIGLIAGVLLEILLEFLLKQGGVI